MHRSYYRVPALLANRHVETIFAAFCRRAPVVQYVRCAAGCRLAAAARLWLPDLSMRPQETAGHARRRHCGPGL